MKGKDQPIINVSDKLTYSYKEAAAALGVGKDAIYKLVEQGELGFVQYGKKRLIPKEDLIDWIRRNKTHSRYGKIAS